MPFHSHQTTPIILLRKLVSDESDETLVLYKGIVNTYSTTRRTIRNRKTKKKGKHIQKLTECVHKVVVSARNSKSS